ncbi:MAG: toxin ParE1/3/4 [Verrucomicrobiales bacterium]
MEQIILHPRARLELLDAVRFYKAVDERLGLDFRLIVERAFQEIERDPYRWRVRPAGYRRVNLRRFPYFIPYVINGIEIRVLAIAHAARRPEYWASRELEM